MPISFNSKTKYSVLSSQVCIYLPLVADPGGGRMGYYKFATATFKVADLVLDLRCAANVAILGRRALLSRQTGALVATRQQLLASLNGRQGGAGGSTRNRAALRSAHLNTGITHLQFQKLPVLVHIM